jgi:hypothetical protein
MKKTDILIILLVLAAIIPGFGQQNALGCTIVRIIPLPGDGRWDYLTLDEHNGRLFVSHGTVTQVVDPETTAGYPHPRPGALPGTFRIICIAPE